MKELITIAQANILFTVLPVLGVLGAIVGALVVRQRGGNGMRVGVLWGVPFLLMGVLWWVYNGITNALGLDSVLNLVVNLGMFLVVGVVCGLGWRWWSAKETTVEAEAD